MMQWEKLGLVFKPAGKNEWDLHSALTPTPLVLHDRVRVFAGLRDAEGISRIGYIDLDKNDPTKILQVSNKPVLDIGSPGTFDDNGIILGDVLQYNNTLYMYYVGFQLVKKAKFLAYTGLATSDDNGQTFKKYSDVPLLDRKQNALFFNAVHTVMFQNNKFKFWLGAGSKFQTINNTSYPSYNVKYIESADGINFTDASIDCLNFSREEEYRIGRPKVYFYNDKYHMIFTWGDLSGNYQMGYAESEDGKIWSRNDAELNFHPSKTGWDDKWVSYGALFNSENKMYMLYNGNQMGREGFGLAILKS